MKNFFFTALLGLLSSLCVAQPTRGLEAYYSFDDCTANDQSGNGANGQLLGNPNCVCGVQGEAMEMRLGTDGILFIGTVNNVFNKKDFTLSLYIKPTLSVGVRHIINKKMACSDENIFDVTLLSGANLLNADLVENTSKLGSVNAPLDFDRCWQHIVVVRAGNTTQLYLNGSLRRESKAVSRVDILNNSVLGINISSNLCQQTNEQPFIGLVDEIRVYDRALLATEIEELYLAPDQLISQDTTIFLGNSVDIMSSTTCATNFNWSPNVDISNITVLEPTVTPSQSTTYTLRMDDNTCTSTDTIRVTVIDPDDLECGEVYLPKAFTPNNDGLNDTYGISNPYAIQELIAFEIFDRWGGRVFATANPFEQWDGRFQGQFMNPGVLLYRVRYICDGQEEADIGSLSIVR